MKAGVRPVREGRATVGGGKYSRVRNEGAERAPLVLLELLVEEEMMLVMIATGVEIFLPRRS